MHSSSKATSPSTVRSITALAFTPERKPFPRWWGPFSPARGKHSGFRFYGGQLGAWVENEHGYEFWPLVDSPGARLLARIVLDEWDGGRLLLLPNGFVVKPLQRDIEVGQRVLLGRLSGRIVLQRPDGTFFDVSNPGQLTPGDRWAGPRSIGLECTINQNGALDCTWYHPTPIGRDEVRESLCGSDRLLAAGFRRARPRDTAGRVHVTPNGYVITNRQEADGTWVSVYVGCVSLASWIHRDEWIER
jgi:hypothetical protein